MAGPGFNVFNHEFSVCVIHEDIPSYNFFTILNNMGPVFFTRTTTTFKFALPVTEACPKICYTTKYSESKDFVIWEADFIEDRIINCSKLQSCKNCEHKDYTSWLEQDVHFILNLIYKYKIVYFKNLNFNYLELFNKIKYEYTKKLGFISSQ